MTTTRFEFSSSEGHPIHGNLDTPASGVGAPVLVCLHGFKGFKDWGFWPEVARRLVPAGYGVVRFNFSHSGIGESPESMTEIGLFETGTYTREVEDLREVLLHLTDRRLPGSEDLDPSRIGLLAHSRGAVAALAVAASGEFPLKSVVLWNPVSSLLWWEEEARRLWRERGYWEVVNTRTGQIFRMGTALLEDAEKNGGQLDPIGNASRLAVPLLVVVAAQDEAVPADSGRRLAQSARSLGSLREISRTGHTFGAVHPLRGATPALEEAIGITLEHLAGSFRKSDCAVR